MTIPEPSAVADLVHRFYAARLRNDAEGCSALFAETASIRFAGVNRLSGFPEKVHTSVERLAVFQTLVTIWPWQALNVRRVMVDGNWAAALIELTTRYARNDETYQSEAMDYFVFDDAGLIVEFAQFADTALVADILKR